MIAENQHNKLVIFSEDAADVEYLENLFAGEVRVIKDSNTVCRGFCKTDEKMVRVTIKKA